MTRYLILLLVAFLSISSASANLGASPVQRLYGKWTWTYAKNNCTEVYDYRRDNTARITSGEEVAESRFSISEQPDARGFYRMIDVVTQSNGKTGCDGQPGGTPVGHEVTIYLLFHPAIDEMLVCQQANLNACMGPLRRVPD